MTRAMAELPSGAVPAQTHIQSIDERMSRGRALRALQPREQQAIWKTPANRRDPIEILIEQGEWRHRERTRGCHKRPAFDSDHG